VFSYKYTILSKRDVPSLKTTLILFHHLYLVLTLAKHSVEMKYLIRNMS